MVTGRDFILYILQNGLEDEPLIKDGKFMGFVGVEEFAEGANVGLSTVQTWIDMGSVKGGGYVDNKYYIPTIYSNIRILK